MMLSNWVNQNPEKRKPFANAWIQKRKEEKATKGDQTIRPRFFVVSWDKEYARWERNGNKF